MQGQCRQLSFGSKSKTIDIRVDRINHVMGVELGREYMEKSAQIS